MKIIYFLTLTFIMVQLQAVENFIYCSEAGPTAFNPQVTTDGTSNNAAAHTIYERLVSFELGSTNIIPALAKSWTISENQLTYIFQLRKDVSFHGNALFTPTRPFNADDVLFSFNRMRLDSHPFHKIGGGNYEYFAGMGMAEMIKEIKKLNDYEIQITLTHPEAPFLANLAMSFMGILSKEYAEKLLEKKTPELIDTQPIGTGRFIFHKYVKDTLIRYKRFEKYWGEAPKIKNLIFSITPDASVRYQKLKVGECHLIIEPLPYDLESIKKEKNITLLSAAGLNVGYMAFNTKKAPFDNVVVRRALSMALNKESYKEAIYLGHAMVAKNPLPPTIWSYNDDVTDYEYNPEKAKELLKAANFPFEKEIELWTLPVSRPYNPNGKKMGEMMQADLAKVGIKVNLISYDWPTYLKKSRQGEHQLIQLGWTGDNGDPDNFLGALLSCTSVEAGSNASKWCDTEFDGLITKAKMLSSQKMRIPLYEKAQERFHDQAPWAPIAHSQIFRAMSKKVTGYKMDPLGGDIFWHVDIIDNDNEEEK